MVSYWPFIQSGRDIEHIYKGAKSPRRVEFYPGCGHHGGLFIHTDQPTQRSIFTLFTSGKGRVVIIMVGRYSYRSSTKCIIFTYLQQGQTPDKRVSAPVERSHAQVEERRSDVRANITSSSLYIIVTIKIRKRREENLLKPKQSKTTTRSQAARVHRVQCVLLGLEKMSREKH